MSTSVRGMSCRRHHRRYCRKFTAVWPLCPVLSPIATDSCFCFLRLFVSFKSLSRADTDSKVLPSLAAESGVVRLRAYSSRARRRAEGRCGVVEGRTEESVLGLSGTEYACSKPYALPKYGHEAQALVTCSVISTYMSESKLNSGS
jgi:hypothetical protein